jgi:excisionase family DNA binding protein
MITAEKVYQELLEMPVQEREKLFAVVARRGFEKEWYAHDEVFDEVHQSPFTLKETAEYLEVAEITVRRWVKMGKLAVKKVEKSLVFDPDDLKQFKKYLPKSRTNQLQQEALNLIRNAKV